MSITLQANILLSSGLSVIPIIMPSKRPGVATWGKYQKVIPTAGELDYTEGVGIICGKVSGGLECFDIDSKYDLHVKDKGLDIVSRLADAMGESAWRELQDTVVMQTTVKGGVHFIYRCAEIAGNQKLAARPATADELAADEHDKTKVLLETRGEGGYFAAEPTPGYCVISGSLTDIPEISVDLRRKLLDAARILNEVWEERREPTTTMERATGGLKSWEAYNEATEIPDILNAHGWKFIKSHGPQQLWKRPGSTDSAWSASYHEGLRLFYLYSSSVANLEPNRAYTAYALTTFWDFGGDFALSARELLKQGYGQGNKPKEILTYQPQNGQIHENSQSSAAPAQQKEVRTAKNSVPTLEEIQPIWKDILVNQKPPEEIVLLRVNGVPVATASNHSLVIGKKKSRKSLYIAWLFSVYEGDLEKDVLLFDTEQGRHHVWLLREKIFKLTRKEVPIFYLRGKSFAERCNIIEGTLKYWSSRPKIIVIDGIRDLMSNINDPDQTSDLIYWLERMTLEHGIHVINVLHTNKTNNDARGHLGSELLNKAEMTTELQKDEMSGVTIVKCESSRGKPFEDFAFTHGYDDLPEVVGMPTKGQVMPESERDERLQACFDGFPMKYAELIEAIKANFEVGRDRARRLLAQFTRDSKVIKSGGDGRGNQNTVYKLA